MSGRNLGGRQTEGRAAPCLRTWHTGPWSFYICPGVGGDVWPMRVAIKVESRDEVGLFVGGSAPEGPGDHSPRLQPWVDGDNLPEALKGATQLLRETCDHPMRPATHPAPIRGGQELVVSPFQGLPCIVTFPTAEAVGCNLWPLRGPSELGGTPLHSQGCYLANVETPGLGMPSPHIAGPDGQLISRIGIESACRT